MQLHEIIIFMGPPGSGKGTQTKLFSYSTGYAYFSTGALSREYAKQDSDFGKRVKSIIDKGIILPIEIIREIFVKKFESLLDSADGVILDGYPRTTEQAGLLEELMSKYGIMNLKAVFLDVDKEKLIKRLSNRKTCVNCQTMYKSDMPEYKKGVCGKCQGKLVMRADDDPSVIEKRFEEYLNKTAPVREYYENKGSLIHINGDQSIESVHKDILKAIRQ